MAGLAQVGRRRYLNGMSRTLPAVLFGLVFIAVYVAAIVVLGDPVQQLHWTLQAIYFLVAGIAWVFPIWWLMLWAVHKR